MQVKRKIGAAHFTYDDAFGGDVEITKGDTTIRLSVLSLQQFVAESIRSNEMERVRRMKPEELLRRLA